MLFRSALFHGQVDIGAAQDVNMAIGGDFNLYTGGSFNIKSAGNIAANAAQDISLKADANSYSDAGGEQYIKAGGNVNVDGAEFHGQEGSAEAAPDSTVDLTPPLSVQSAKDSYQLLTTPVRPSPPVDIKTELLDNYLAEAANTTVNPEYDAAGVGAVAAKPQPVVSADPPAGETQSVNSDGSDLVTFLQKQEQLGKEGYWTEKAMTSEIGRAHV